MTITSEEPEPDQSASPLPKAPKRANVFARFGRNRTFRRVISKRITLICLVVVIILFLVAIFAGLVAPYDPDVQDLQARDLGPSWDHLLGTDKFGRDIFSRLTFACRVTMWAAVQGLSIACLLGIPLGLVAGYTGGWLDGVLSRIADGLMALPPLIYAMAIIGMLGPGLTNAMIAVGIVLAPRFFRLARAAAVSASKEAFAEAARADGVSSMRILWRHVLPNSAGPLLVQATFGIGLIISAEVSLSFLGLGVQLPTSSWGSMIRQAFDDISVNSWPMIPPITAIIVTIAAFFLLGDGLRDAIGRDSSNTA